MTMKTTMQAIAGALTAAGMPRVVDWPTESVNVPCAVVSYPELDFDFVYGGGRHLATYPVWVLVGRADVSASRDAVTPYIDSLVPALNGTLGGAVDSASCTRGRLAATTIANIAYLGLMLSVEVIES